jgi:hypothetical protein
MRDFDPAQLVHTVPRGLREGVKVKDLVQGARGEEGRRG